MQKRNLLQSHHQVWIACIRPMNAARVACDLCLSDNLQQTTIWRYRNVVTIANHLRFNRVRWTHQLKCICCDEMKRLWVFWAHQLYRECYVCICVVHNYVAINANLSFFSPVEPFSKSRIIVHSLRSGCPLHHHTNITIG